MAGEKKAWKKVLYGNEGYPDNYTDASFLEELKKNVNIREVTFSEAFMGASLVTQQFSLVICFVIAFVYLYNAWSSPADVLSYSSALSFFGYLVYTRLESTTKLRHLRAVLVFFLLGYLLSPVLKTLTESVSTDTIYASTVFMMGIHLIFFDYGVKALIVSSSLSVNAGIFGSLCLASRLPSPFHAFVLLAVAVECFVLCPVLLSKIGNSLSIITAIILICVYGLSTFSFTATVFFVFAVVFINLVCPLLFVRWHAYKDNIYGPWDEAVVQDINVKQGT